MDSGGDDIQNSPFEDYIHLPSANQAIEGGGPAQIT